MMYTYKILEITRVIDGDTIDIIVDLGFYITRKIRIRMEGYNAPEIRGKNKEYGKQAKLKLLEIINSRSDWMVKTYKKTGIYGRYSGVIYSSDNSINVNNIMKEYCDDLWRQINGNI